VVVIGASNRPDLIDTGLLRPGRIDKIVFVPLPDKEGRKQVLGVHLKRVPLAKDVDLEKILDRMDGFTGADIAAMVKEAGLFAIRESKSAKEVAMRHFEHALAKAKPRMSKEDAADWERQRARWQS